MPPALSSAPDPLERRQRLRVFRHFMAAASSLLTVVLAYAYAWFGHLSYAAALHFTGAVACSVTVFTLTFVLGINRRFADPSLTVAQLLTAGAALSWLAFEGPDIRSLLIGLYAVTLMFGAFRLSTGALLAVGACFLAMYAAGVGLDLWLRRQPWSATNEGVQLVHFAAVVVWVAWIGGYINRLRIRLRSTNEELKQALQRIEVVASFDEVTGLYNRRTIRDILAKEKSRCERTRASLCIAMLDIDHFKRINDLYGHAMGDRVLKAVATVLHAGLRGNDSVGRYGGEEFIVVLTECQAGAALLPLERLRLEIEAMTVEGLPREHKVTASIGTAVYRCGEDIDLAIQRADAALYEAKRSGRNQVVCHA
ncbi:GGDEF domain-containing protein [Schlegelella sp. S2-27]|uniref:diguanylate cyclase n=1 Tax=Caldimonas mangrovi TaxID=2944811 RepID=A0ABT0YSM0_9BURK|nr:GGDEF domain-containing protein [Caldimonas mangrovi]MCM5681730.1 GGDEF domain-containing protein [Caldimonas mangrovi]